MTSVRAELNTNAIYEAGEEYVRLGISVIPIQPHTKEPPEGFKWGQFAQRIASADERFHWFVERGYQIGIVAGEDFVPLDFDSLTGFESLAVKYPILRTFPRIKTGSGKHHVWVRPERPTAYYETRTPDDGKLEVRAGVHYTVAPPSIHPDTGKPYIWEIEPGTDGIPTIALESIGLKTVTPRTIEPGEPVDTEGKPLTDAERDHLVSIIEPHWIPYSRHEICLSLAGWLSGKRVPESDTLEVIRELAESNGDEKRMTEFRRAIRDTYRKAREGIAVGGWSKLTDRDAPLIPPSAAAELDLLLRGRDASFMFDVVAASDKPRHPYIVSITELLNEPEEPDLFLCEGLIRATSLGLTVGPPKTFKSFLEQELHIAIATGTPALGTFPTGDPKVTVYVQEESSRGALRRRFRLLLNGRGIHPAVVADTLYTVTNQGVEMDNPDSVRRFVDEVMRVYEPAFITFDPLREIHGQDENSSKDMRPILKMFKELREEFQVSIQLVHHNNKNPLYDNPADSIRGTTSIWGAMDGALFVGKTDNKDVMLVTPNLKEGGQEDAFLYSIQQEGDALVLKAIDKPDAGVFTVAEIVAWASAQGDWWGIERAIELLPVGESTIRRVVRQAIATGALKDRKLKHGKKAYAHLEVDDDEPTF